MKPARHQREPDQSSHQDDLSHVTLTAPDQGVVSFTLSLQIDVQDGQPTIKNAQVTRTTRTSTATTEPLTPAPRPPHYALQLRHGAWLLTFAGQQVPLKHEQGLYYAQYLLGHPNEPVPAALLFQKFNRRLPDSPGIAEITGPDTGEVTALSDDSIPREIFLSRDTQEILKRHKLQLAKLQATVDDPTTPEHLREDALTQRDQLRDFLLAQFHNPPAGPQQAASKRVRKSLSRLLTSLRAPPRPGAKPDPIKSRFADFLHKYLFLPSRRFTAPGQRAARGELAGKLLYESPPQTRWLT